MAPNGQVIPIPIWEGGDLVDPRDLEVLPNGDLLIVDPGFPKGRGANVEDGAVYRLTGPGGPGWLTGPERSLQLLAGNPAAISYKPVCIKVPILLGEVDVCSYNPPFPDDLFQVHGMLDPKTISADENGEFFVFDPYTNHTRVGSFPMPWVFDASLFHFDVNGILKSASQLRLPPRPWSHPNDNARYTGLVFTNTTDFFCLYPEYEGCRRPELNGALLSLKSPGETLELRAFSNPANPWNALWVPIGDSDGNIYFGSVSTVEGDATPIYMMQTPAAAQAGEWVFAIGQLDGSPAFDKDGSLLVYGPDKLHFYERGSSATEFSEKETAKTIKYPDLHGIATLGHPE
jgi:hypothetical protein